MLAAALLFNHRAGAAPLMHILQPCNSIYILLFSLFSLNFSWFEFYTSVGLLVFHDDYKTLCFFFSSFQFYFNLLLSILFYFSLDYFGYDLNIFQQKKSYDFNQTISKFFKAANWLWGSNLRATAADYKIFMWHHRLLFVSVLVHYWRQFFDTDFCDS